MADIHNQISINLPIRLIANFLDHNFTLGELSLNSLEDCVRNSVSAVALIVSIVLMDEFSKLY